MAAPIFRFAGMNTLSDPAAINCFNGKSPQYGQCVDICNCDLDDEHNAISRDGFARVVAGDITSACTIRGVTYCVYGGYLCTFNGNVVATLTMAFTVLPDVEFMAVNDVVAFSDNAKIGIIEGGTATLIDRAADWVGVADLERWVTTHFPTDFEAEASNFEVDAFKLATLAGKCLEFFNGALYLAIDNFIYCTKTYNIEHMDIRYNVVAGFPDAVTMIRHVTGGLFVGTAKGAWFLEGNGLVVDEEGKILEGFTQRQVSSYGVIYGTALQVDAENVPAAETQGKVALWASKHGIFAGCMGGVAINLSADKVALPDVSKGTALFREKGGVAQYVVCFDVASSLFTDGQTKINASALQGTYVLNLRKLTHSRFARWPFNSLFRRGADYYGANVNGIYRFTGDTDFSGVAALAQKVAVFVLTPVVDFGTRKVKHGSDIYLQGRCTGDMAVDLIVDEEVAAEDIPIYYDEHAGVHVHRGKLPRGVKGTAWQFKLKNVNGSRFTAIDLEPVVAASATRTR